jgi:succinyl-diaminopimelate desuccinylase
VCCTELDETTIKQRVLEIFDRFDFDYEISWRLSGNPFLTSGGTLIEAAHTTGIDIGYLQAGGGGKLIPCIPDFFS